MDSNHYRYVLRQLKQFAEAITRADDEDTMDFEFVLDDHHGMSQLIGFTVNNRETLSNVMLTLASKGVMPVVPLIGRDDDHVWTMFTFNNATTGVLVGLPGSLDMTATATGQRYLDHIALGQMSEGLGSMPDNAAEFLKKANGHG